MEDLTDSKPQVTYWAISTFNSKTIWAGAGTIALGVLADPELRGLLTTLIPLRYLPKVISIIGVMIIVLRKFTTRPIALIPPGETMPVLVDKVGPPAPPLVTD